MFTIVLLSRLSIMMCVTKKKVRHFIGLTVTAGSLKRALIENSFQKNYHLSNLWMFIISKLVVTSIWEVSKVGCGNILVAGRNFNQPDY